jgi:predicted helicase
MDDTKLYGEEMYRIGFGEAVDKELLSDYKVIVLHVDGTMGAQTRERKLQWLKSADTGKQNCHILNNVRCLSEGVDVPSLDAVMFLSARNSQIDVVQSVGRVMRKAPNKKYGYIIIPVVVPSTAEPEKILASDRYLCV